MNFRTGAVTAISVLALASGAAPQTGPQPAPAVPENPQAMPGDYFDIPQSTQLQVPLGPPAGKNARPLPVSATAVPSPGARKAIEIAETAEQTCAADGYIVAVAVTDSEGNLKAAVAPDGTRSNGVYMAMHKAVTVTAFRMSTLSLRYAIAKNPSLLARVKPNMSLLPGGLPLLKDGQFIGAVAVSGAAAHEEEKCGQAGIARFDGQR